MVHSVLFAMSLSGSVIVMCYLLTYRVAQRFFSPGWRYLILKTAMLLYLAPVFLLIRFTGIWPGPQPSAWENPPVGGDLRPVEILCGRKEEIRPDMGAGIRLAASVISGLITVALPARQISGYRKMKRLCLTHSCEASEEWLKCLEAVRKELGIRVRVRLLCSAFCESPMVLGILSPVVILPLWEEKEQDAAAMKYIIKHELVHVRAHDLQIRFMGLAVRSLHWFNPLCIFMYDEILRMSEICCDYMVIREEGEEGRRAYSHLLLRLAVQSGRDSDSPARFGRIPPGQKKDEEKTGRRLRHAGRSARKINRKLLWPGIRAMTGKDVLERRILEMKRIGSCESRPGRRNERTDDY